MIITTSQLSLTYFTTDITTMYNYDEENGKVDHRPPSKKY